MLLRPSSILSNFSAVLLNPNSTWASSLITADFNVSTSSSLSSMRSITVEGIDLFKVTLVLNIGYQKDSFCNDDNRNYRRESRSQ